jgi:hypothetical protein
MQNFDPDQRQIPMGLGWPIMFRSLEDGGDFDLLLLNHAVGNNRLERPVIAINTRWEAERDAKAVLERCAAPASNELVPRARNNRGMCMRY